MESPELHPDGEAELVRYLELMLNEDEGRLVTSLLVNGQVPGPLIVANKSDELNLNVIDQLTNETMLLSTSIHWHGFFETNNSWADGVAFIHFPRLVTQCPIAVNNSFLYTIPTNDQAGTFWYHSHLATQYCDGLRGPLVVYDPDDPHADLYDADNETTIITLADWCKNYHGPASTLGNIPTLISTLINGLGRFAGANITTCRRNRHIWFAVSDASHFQSCDPNFIFTIDGHNMTIIEADGTNTEPLTYAGQRYSFVLTADQDVDHYWIRTVANGGTTGFDNGINSAILRYLVETDLHPLVATAVPGTAVAGGADVTMNLIITLNTTTFDFGINGETFTPPTVPVLLQILSGAQLATGKADICSHARSKYPSPAELRVRPSPFHLHGHNFFVVKSAGNSTYNFNNPIVRDVVNTGTDTTDNTTIRFTTDNPGPWILHCHIDFHLELYVVLHPFRTKILISHSSGLAIVFAEDTAGITNSSMTSTQWADLCPIYDALDSSDL
ncbi:laccase [Mycena maculata]|uniref:Laccase n=1 Tax=Mycena maculata TaxID=230809 RepID=A0AAD7MKC0_9AGAR|nr:laccase [Mycena maculata]